MQFVVITTANWTAPAFTTSSWNAAGTVGAPRRRPPARQAARARSSRGTSEMALIDKFGRTITGTIGRELRKGG